MPDENNMFDRQLARMVQASRYAERLVARDPSHLDELRCYGETALTAEMFHAALPSQLGNLSEVNFNHALRQLRQRAMLRLIFRDINGLAALDEVLTCISALADVTLAAATDFHRHAVARAYALPPTWADDPASELAVVAMGKLGAHELNVSSDIDLIFVHADDGDATAARTWRDYHVAVGKGIIRSLDTQDENGFVFRVDMRLRPFGDSGGLVSSIASLADYFRQHARPWERYAWLKARALTGGAALKTALEALVLPFVFRRYHDFNAINEMRELFAQIRNEAIKRNKQDDIKVGVGGIRQIEFIAQLHQLIRGGREVPLQTRSTRAALTALAARELLTPLDAARLQTAYAFLRNLEHRLQYLDDTQTQALPSNEADRTRVAQAMNFPDWETFHSALTSHRDIVKVVFDALFSNESTATTAPENNTVTALEANIHAVFGDVTGERAALHDAILTRVTGWQKAARTATLSARTVARIETLLVNATEAALRYPGQELTTALALFDLFDAVDKRETYLALLTEYPAALDRVARIAAKSAWAADFLKRHPILLESLISPTPTRWQIDWPQEKQQLQRACDEARDDIERQYEILRHTKHTLTLRLNVADIEGQIDVMSLSDELSRLADMLLDTTLVLAARVAGFDIAGWDPPPGFAILGYGKLGSKELGYASDLDLVFLYDETSTTTAERYARLAQRLTSWLNTTTRGGELYDTDLRLRPDGAAGMLVSSVTAFRDYQQTRAWTWEHQALTRARWCAGDPRLAPPFEAIRQAVICQPREISALRSDINAMRQKMRADKPDPVGRRNLKHTEGGMVDVEFIVQFIILGYARAFPELLGNLGNFALLQRAGAVGILDPALADHIAHAYLLFRQAQHRARTNNEAKTLIEPDHLADQRAAVIKAWRALLGEPR